MSSAVRVCCPCSSKGEFVQQRDFCATMYRRRKPVLSNYLACARQGCTSMDRRGINDGTRTSTLKSTFDRLFWCRQWKATGWQSKSIGHHWPTLHTRCFSSCSTHIDQSAALPSVAVGSPETNTTNSGDWAVVVQRDRTNCLNEAGEKKKPQPSCGNFSSVVVLVHRLVLDELHAIAVFHVCAGRMRRRKPRNPRGRSVPAFSAAQLPDDPDPTQSRDRR
ncbi:hypothetical protein QBC40DRAFT_312871 [Triangularia verruculosa]|uniref:Uncharacterized protein n=1 Tax=Triangularia verruculosa TaxID=2587418 RepID=A0AAN7ARR2_9PEZI|nr:hypothetical protein QBC40DRAFT_312871 [Triangularia verruculosa]